MDTDPLADVGPPRHAIESDDEDEFNPQSLQRPPPKHDLDFEIVNAGKATAETLIFASLEAGRIWAKGADLGEQLGTIGVNKKCVGMVFNPGWTDAIVVVSEVLTRLPVWAQYPYAEYVLNQLKPARLLLLDSYAASGYIHPEWVPLHRAPVRYLTLDDYLSIPKDFEPFNPPNLIQSTSAVFFSLISLARQVSAQPSAEVTLFLFPGPYRPLNTPDDLTSTVSSLTESDDLWSRNLTKYVHEVLSGGNHEWNLKGKGGSFYSQEKRKPHVEGSMYI